MFFIQDVPGILYIHTYVVVLVEYKHTTEYPVQLKATLLVKRLVVPVVQVTLISTCFIGT